MAAASVCTRALQAKMKKTKTDPLFKSKPILPINKPSLPCLQYTSHYMYPIFRRMRDVCCVLHVTCLDVCAPGFPPRTSQLWLVFIFFSSPRVSIYICVGTRQTALEM